MNTQNKELRRLAEKYFFEKARLEEHEIALLKNSRFSNVLSPIEGSVFSELAESALKEIEKNSLEKPKKETSAENNSSSEKPFHHASSGDLEALTDSIKDEFDITVPPDYSHVPVDKLKEFIKNYTEQYIEDLDTRYELQSALKFNEPRAIMGSLYTHLAM